MRKTSARGKNQGLVFSKYCKYMRANICLRLAGLVETLREREKIGFKVQVFCKTLTHLVLKKISCERVLT